LTELKDITRVTGKTGGSLPEYPYYPLLSVSVLHDRITNIRGTDLPGRPGLKVGPDIRQREPRGTIVTPPGFFYASWHKTSPVRAKDKVTPAVFFF
jgi:hypothetical protein